MKKIFAIAAVAMLGLGSAASAATFTIVGGTTGDTIPGGSATNEVINSLALTDPANSAGIETGSFGSSINFSGGSDVRFDFIGFEAGFINSFAFNGTTLFTTTGGQRVADTVNAPLQSAVVSSMAGPLTFSFTTSNPSGSLVSQTVTNGDDNLNEPTHVNFFASQQADGSVWLFLDDVGGGDDDNHDDLVIRISAVPLPAGGLLLLTGLGALALRRRKKAA